MFRLLRSKVKHVWSEARGRSEILSITYTDISLMKYQIFVLRMVIVRIVYLGFRILKIQARYDEFGEIDDLNEMVVLSREILSLCPPGHIGHAMSLGNLSIHLSSRYDVLGGIDDLNEAIVRDREALPLCPPGHTLRPICLNYLAVHLATRYDLLGTIDELNEAIVLDREALSLRPPGHPDRSESLDSLATCLTSRYRLLRAIDDIKEAIALSRETLSLTPPGDFDRSSSLNNLALDLSYLYDALRGINDLNEAIILGREALSLCTPGDPDRPMSLSNLAGYLSRRYDLLGENDDLEEAIVLAREALSLHPPGYLDRSLSLNNLAQHLFTRYSLQGGIDDLEEAITLAQEAVTLRPTGHPLRSSSLNSLANCLSSRYNLLWETGNFSAALEHQEEMFSLYTELEHVSHTTSSGDLSAAKAWVNAAETFGHPTTLLAYETALRLLVQYLTALPSLPQHLDLLKSLSSSLAVDAFSACLRNQSPTKAVELLEQGRAVFWSQLTRLRSPLDSVVESGPEGEVLAAEFTRLTSLIRNILSSPGSDQHDRVFNLNVELQQVVYKIRELSSDLSRFLLPLPFSELRSAAREGPVIIMNASEYGCDALIVFSDKDPIHIPLPVTKEEVQKLSLRLRSLTRNANRISTEETEKEFGIFLRQLWEELVSHILDVLQKTCPRNSRIWWCPTAEFSLLPLHAAGPYRKGQKGLSDLYVSSYTTTLTALIRARRTSLPDPPSREKPRFIAIGQAVAKGASQLSCVDSELRKIGELVDGRATFRRIEGEDACVSAVADELGKNDWVHFACHGVPNQEKPFETAFALYDGPLTTQRISQCDLQSPEFAYLSACHTTVGDQESPDEVIHLASAMQFAGFRSVIGTMWAVDDSQTNKVISKFYELMIDDKSGCLDYTRAARALRMTMKKVDIPMDQRVLYIHLGA